MVSLSICLSPFYVGLLGQHVLFPFSTSFPIIQVRGSSLQRQSFVRGFVRIPRKAPPEFHFNCSKTKADRIYRDQEKVPKPSRAVR
jgi:hypothetical protein